MFSGPGWYQLALGFIVVFGAVSFPALFFITAPYGRHFRQGWGPTIPARWGWVVMEAPSPILFAAVYFTAPDPWRPAALVLCALWLTHYVYRAFVFPFRMRGAASKRKPLFTVGLAFVFNVANGSVNAWAITRLAPHLDGTQAFDGRFVVGVALFITGYAINHAADATLRRLRAPGETGYKIPRGGLYRWVSSPNYLGEIIEWSGFAIAAYTAPAAAFALFTVANLLPRALDHHRWYQRTFPDYPPERRAIIPRVL
jgi:protein-S-isoprenylcysteine O-methyltransferase Ste14